MSSSRCKWSKPPLGKTEYWDGVMLYTLSTTISKCYAHTPHACIFQHQFPQYKNSRLASLVEKDHMIWRSLTNVLLVRRYKRRSPYLTNSVRRQRGSCVVTHPSMETTWGLWPSETFFISSISDRKSCRSLPLAEAAWNIIMHVNIMLQRLIINCKYISEWGGPLLYKWGGPLIYKWGVHCYISEGGHYISEGVHCYISEGAHWTEGVHIV